MDPRLDGAERDAGHLGDLGVVVALDVVQDDGRPLVVGDARPAPRDRTRVRSARTAVRSGSASSPAGGCQLSSSSSGYGWTGRRLRARCVSIAALTQIRLSHDLTLPPRNAAQVAVRREERLLDAVGRLVAIGDHPHDEREQLVLVEHDEVVERVEVAARGLARAG